MSDEARQLPRPQTGDYLQRIAKALLSVIPDVGGPAAELFAMIIAPPLAKRRDESLEDL
jgi:hypothetical protein